MRLQKYFLSALIAFGGACVSSATTLTFTYTGSNYGPGVASIPAQTLSGISVSEIGVWANVYNSGATVTGTANDFAATDIAEYVGDGIGVCNPSEQAAGCPSPQHQIDNYQGMDFALFSFSAAVSLNDVSVVGFGNPEGPPTQTYNDVDLSYSILSASQVTALNNGSLPFSAVTFTTFNTNFLPSNDYSLTGTGQYVLIGAAVTPYYGDASNQATPDAFKIQTLTVNTVSASTPEPSSWILLGSGLLGVAFFAKRRLRSV